MNMYATPKEGTYDYKSPNFDGTFNLQQVKVAVLGESEKQYLIRLTLPVGNHRPNDQMKVRKHNVRVHGMTNRPSDRRTYDYSAAFRNE
jgi:hypothetical protein